MTKSALWLKRGRERAFLNGHPWVFSGAIEGYDGEPEAGDIVEVRDHEGAVLGHGHFNPNSQIVIRRLTLGDAEVPPTLIADRIAQADVARRELGVLDETDAYRVVFSEGDALPGLIVDRYADFLVVQLLTAGMDRARDEVVAALVEHLSPRGIYERSDADSRGKEGLKTRTGVLHGEEPPEHIRIQEDGVSYRVDVRSGHKTGFYLDQRVSRRRVGARAKGKRVLNAFSYTGGFGVRAAAAGAERVVNLDVSGPALAIASANAADNGVADVCETLEEDAFEALRRLGKEGARFDLIVLDPPKFATSKASVKRATRGYKDLNLQALKLLAPGGLLYTFSCSGLIDADLFQKVVFGAALDADRELQVIERLGQGPDHPFRIRFREGEYLKGLVCRAV